MNLSINGKTSLIKREGNRLTSYQDGAGVWTVGVGHTGTEVHRGMHISQAQSDLYFSEDVQWAERAVKDLVYVDLNRNQFDSLVSFVFNIGSFQFETSTLLKELNNGNYSAVPHQMMRWNKITVDGEKVVSKGLVNRRVSEVAQWNSINVVADTECGDTPSKPTGRKPMAILKNSKTTAAGTTVAGLGGYSFIKDLIDKVNETKEGVSGLLTDQNMIYFVVACVGVFIVVNRIMDSKKGRSY